MLYICGASYFWKLNTRIKFRLLALVLSQALILQTLRINAGGEDVMKQKYDEHMCK